MGSGTSRSANATSTEHGCKGKSVSVGERVRARVFELFSNWTPETSPSIDAALSELATELEVLSLLQSTEWEDMNAGLAVVSLRILCAAASRDELRAFRYVIAGVSAIPVQLQQEDGFIEVFGLLETSMSKLRRHSGGPNTEAIVQHILDIGDSMLTTAKLRETLKILEVRTRIYS